jgi:hypothetical protein
MFQKMVVTIYYFGFACLPCLPVTKADRLGTGRQRRKRARWLNFALHVINKVLNGEHRLASRLTKKRVNGINYWEW